MKFGDIAKVSNGINLVIKDDGCIDIVMQLRG